MNATHVHMIVIMLLEFDKADTRSAKWFRVDFGCNKITVCSFEMNR